MVDPFNLYGLSSHRFNSRPWIDAIIAIDNRFYQNPDEIDGLRISFQLHNRQIFFLEIEDLTPVELEAHRQIF